MPMTSTLFYQNEHRISKLTIYAEKCDGQNKNLFVLMNFCWFAMFGPEDIITTSFKVAAYTMNVVDSAFGYVKTLKNEALAS